MNNNNPLSILFTLNGKFKLISNNRSDIKSSFSLLKMFWPSAYFCVINRAEYFFHKFSQTEAWRFKHLPGIYQKIHNCTYFCLLPAQWTNSYCSLMRSIVPVGMTVQKRCGVSPPAGRAARRAAGPSARSSSASAAPPPSPSTSGTRRWWSPSTSPSRSSLPASPFFPQTLIWSADPVGGGGGGVEFRILIRRVHAWVTCKNHFRSVCIRIRMASLYLVQENQFDTMEISFDKMKKIHLENCFLALFFLGKIGINFWR